MEIELGRDPVSGAIVMYEAPHADLSILSTITSILVPILISAGLKALVEFITKGEFALAYPGGKVKLVYDVTKEDTKNEKVNKYIAALKLENILD